jgi:rfaE bifunctional protein nucleotidyltransferase chain/domain
MTKLEIIASKVLGGESLERQLALWRFKNERLVFTNGCFDILHRGHIEYLARAADLGSLLIVGLNTDASVKRLKGISRPVNNEHDRALLLASLHFVDAVILFDDDTPYRLIQRIQPDILVKGGDYQVDDIVGNDIVRAKGGQIIVIDLLRGYSTTSLYTKIREMHG